MKMFCQKKPTQKPKKPKNQIKKDETAKKITSKNLSGVKKTSHWLADANLGQANNFQWLVLKETKYVRSVPIYYLCMFTN